MPVLDKEFSKQPSSCFCLDVFHVNPIVKEARVPTFPTTETQTPSAPAPPIKITITNTEQTATINNLDKLWIY